MLASLGIDPHFLLISTIGFLILVFVLTKYAFRPLLEILEARQNTIRGNLDEAEARRDEMVQLKAQYEQLLAKIEDDARDKIQAAIRDAQAARDEIVAKAHAESHAVLQRGLQEMEQERAKAMEEMRNEIADLAILAASRIIKTNLDSSANAALIQDVINSVGATNGHGAGSSN